MATCSSIEKRMFGFLAPLTLICLTPKSMLKQYQQKFVAIPQVEYVVMVDGKEKMASRDYLACLAYREYRVHTDLRSCPTRCKMTFRQIGG